MNTARGHGSPPCLPGPSTSSHSFWLYPPLSSPQEAQPPVLKFFWSMSTFHRSPRAPFSPPDPGLRAQTAAQAPTHSHPCSSEVPFPWGAPLRTHACAPSRRGVSCVNTARLHLTHTPQRSREGIGPTCAPGPGLSFPSRLGGGVCGYI